MPISVTNPYTDIQPYFRNRHEILVQGTCDNCGLEVEALVYIALIGNLSPNEAQVRYQLGPEHPAGVICENPQATLQLLTTLA